MNVISITILSGLSAVVLFGSRRSALLGLVAGVLYLTQGQFLDVGGLDMFPTRVLVALTALRLVVRSELGALRPNSLDAVVLALYAYATAVYLIQHQEGQLTQVGIAVDAIFFYFSFRALVASVEDLAWLLRGLVVLLIPYVALLWFESLTFQNPFAAIGGVELARAGDRWVREGRLRATGSFGHPSLLGTLGGSFLPLYVAMALNRGHRAVGIVGTNLCVAVVLASNSGGPVLCAVAAMMAWLLWPMRLSMRFIRVALVALTVLAALLMKDPIWYLIARLGSVTGGDAYHRSLLLDVAFQNLDKWWLAGMPLRDTAWWLPYNNTLTGHVDLTNTFLQFALTTGLGSLSLLITLLVTAYKRLGRALESARRDEVEQGARTERLLWGLGAVLFVHVVNWFAIAYWDQTMAVWFLHLALVGSLTNQTLITQESEIVATSAQCAK
jgi:hypothetical protein